MTGLYGAPQGGMRMRSYFRQVGAYAQDWRYTMFVFVCSPYRGNIRRNKRYAQECCELEMALGHTAFAPHLYFPQFTEDDDTGIQHGLEVLSRCDELHVFSQDPTPGMRVEIEYAESAGIPVRWMVGR